MFFRQMSARHINSASVSLKLISFMRIEFVWGWPFFLGFKILDLKNFFSSGVSECLLFMWVWTAAKEPYIFPHWQLNFSVAFFSSSFESFFSPEAWGEDSPYFYFLYFFGGMQELIILIFKSKTLSYLFQIKAF